MENFYSGDHCGVLPGVGVQKLSPGWGGGKGPQKRAENAVHEARSPICYEPPLESLLPSVARPSSQAASLSSHGAMAVMMAEMATLTFFLLPTWVG